jgi:predicted nucleotidyltransferase
MSFPETKFGQILEVLSKGEIRFIVVGGLAAMAQGNARSTYDVDVVYSRQRENIRRLADVVGRLQPYLRGAPPGLPFTWDEKTIRMGLNFTLTTSLGDLDLLGEVTGAGTYEQLLPHSEEMVLFGVKCRCATLERLIQMKRAAGRPKDMLVIAELVALLEERRKKERGETS